MELKALRESNIALAFRFGSTEEPLGFWVWGRNEKGDNYDSRDLRALRRFAERAKSYLDGHFSALEPNTKS